MTGEADNEGTMGHPLSASVCGWVSLKPQRSSGTHSSISITSPDRPGSAAARARAPSSPIWLCLRRGGRMAGVMPPFDGRNHALPQQARHPCRDRREKQPGNDHDAKAARHALPAVVPHHGTLLKVARDGSTTEIVAHGFRAPNGVCVEPDGTFWMTDQEGHWHPKNRINHVRPGRFYGNMFGYHDVTDPADAAM